MTQTFTTTLTLTSIATGVLGNSILPSVPSSHLGQALTSLPACQSVCLSHAPVCTDKIFLKIFMHTLCDPQDNSVYTGSTLADAAKLPWGVLVALNYMGGTPYTWAADTSTDAATRE
jgi:hypothetical protein